MAASEAFRSSVLFAEHPARSLGAVDRPLPARRSQFELCAYKTWPNHIQLFYSNLMKLTDVI